MASSLAAAAVAAKLLLAPSAAPLAVAAQRKLPTLAAWAARPLPFASHCRAYSAVPQQSADDGDAPFPPPDFKAGDVAPHRSMKAVPPFWKGTVPADVTAAMNNPIYDKEYVESVTPRHVPAKAVQETIGMRGVQLVRSIFDRATGYGPDMTEAKWLQRMVFLETVAGVPGMVAGMLRHLRSLRTMKADHGWINTLLDEAENERMHLLTFLELRQPGPVFRGMVLLTQGVLFNCYFVAYLLSPKTCHAAVGYLEEKAVKTYTHALHDIDAGRLWPNKPAPELAKQYWKLGDDATMRDLILAIRADEACHSHVNHTLARIPQDAANPFVMGATKVP